MSVRFFVAGLILLLAAPVHAQMTARPLDYEVGGKKMSSVLVYDTSVTTPRPGIVMAPDWKGMNADQVALAKQLAGKDYVILVADVYGVEVRPKNSEEAGAAAKAMYADRTALRARINAALAQLKAQVGKAPLDGKHWAAIGFCFGGAVALDLARSGADIAAVATFHGNLATDDPALARNIKARVLVMNGGDDTYVSAEQILAFQKEMRDAGVDWQFISYGGAVHCFAIPSAVDAGPGCKYNPRAANRAVTQMHLFFDETFYGGASIVPAAH